MNLKQVRKEMMGLWDYLYQNPEETKNSAIINNKKFKHIYNYKNMCPACEYANQMVGQLCDGCPIKEWRNHPEKRCGLHTSVFHKWYFSYDYDTLCTPEEDLETRRKAALEIYNLSKNIPGGDNALMHTIRKYRK